MGVKSAIEVDRSMALKRLEVLSIFRSFRFSS